MKIRALDAIGNIKVGDIVEAVLNSAGNAARVYDPMGAYSSLEFYESCFPRFEIVKEDKKDEKKWCSVNDEKWYSLEELKQLKELFK